MSKDKNSPGAYRPCVGVMLVNANGKVFVGKRIDAKETMGETMGTSDVFWQMPQGGVDKGEDLTAAALRELQEETGVTADMVTVLKQMAEGIAYDLPPELADKLWGGKFRGQMQSWFLLRFTGDDADINLEAHNPPEFCEWQWADPETLPEMIVPFKKRVYRTVLEEFRELV